jgi:hypothetical protein
MGLIFKGFEGEGHGERDDAAIDRPPAGDGEHDMVGGTIVDIVKVTPAKWWVNCVERHDQCAIYLNPAGLPLEVGDGLWWQGRSAFWTPASGACADVELERIGFSGVPHPDLPRCPTCGCTVEFCNKGGGCPTATSERAQ